MIKVRGPNNTIIFAIMYVVRCHHGTIYCKIFVLLKRMSDLVKTELVSLTG